MYLPLYLDVEGKKILVIGLGEVGKRRAKKLSDHGGEVKAVDQNPVTISGVETIQDEIEVDNIPSLEDFFLVVAATNDEELNSKIAEKAREENVLVNRAGDFEEGDVAFPAIVKNLQGEISITSLGENPSLIKKIKERMEDELSGN